MNSLPSSSQIVAPPGEWVTPQQTAHLIAESLSLSELRERRILVIVPDHTRTAPIGMVFQALHAYLTGHVAALDVLVALGTHPPMTEDAIAKRLELTPEQRHGPFANVRFINHEWKNPAALQQIGVWSKSDVLELSHGQIELETVDMK